MRKPIFSRNLPGSLLPLTVFLFSTGSVLADDNPSAMVEQGRYLALAGNCESCHSSRDGEPFAGGVEFTTPFGKLYSTNITPDEETGIGKWTLEQFTKAMREGVRPDGGHLYPAFPYPSFSKLRDADIAAIFSYLRTLTPVSAAPRDNDLRFPYNQRWGLGLWKALYLKQGQFQPDPKQSEEWNRGAYLVQGLGHCGACHTPRNFLGAEQDGLALTGGTYFDTIEGTTLPWSASNLTSAADGLAAWSVDELADYLKLGVSHRASVFGPMNDVIVNSTSKLTAEDTRAIAVYLKGLLANTQGVAEPAGADILQEGELKYTVHCGTCHLPTGLGASDTGPPLVGSAIVLATDPASLINVTLYGPQLPGGPPSPQWQSRPTQPMGAFADKLTDEEAAALLSYIRGSWGNKAGAVTAEMVSKHR
jgi:mono/diheme cytochrome c family protein